MVTNEYMAPLFQAAAEATEEAILNALLAAGDITGRDGITAHGLTPESLLGALEEARRGYGSLRQSRTCVNLKRCPVAHAHRR
jgi:Peptidase family S58